MKKGFTLMEILAVLLVIAVLASFVVPVVRTVMAEIRYHQAKVAGIKMAEAIRIFYKDSRGYRIGGYIYGTEAGTTIATSAEACNNPAVSGIPSESGGNSVDVEQLFYCNYLSAKDFSGLSDYTFHPGACQGPADCLVEVNDLSKKNAKGCFRVLRDSSILEGVEGCEIN